MPDLSEPVGEPDLVASPNRLESCRVSLNHPRSLQSESSEPPSPSDVEETERLSRQLDLGPLIDRMPGGLLQMVGETGWQLSHGEKSRLFLARALLQGADLVLLDETFSALDPETLSRTLPRVLDLAPTLVVIAHP